MYQLIALDLDGTLLKNDGTISPYNKAILQQAQAQGIMVTLATGRMYGATLPFAQELALTLPLITCHGALIQDAAGRVVSHLPLATTLVDDIYAFMHAQHTHIRFYAQDTLYMSDLSPQALAYAQMLQVTPHQLPESIIGMNPTKMAVVDEPERINAFMTHLRKKYGADIYVTKVNDHFLEISNPLATKGLALKTLTHQLHLDPQDVLVFGDSYNDLPMFQFAGCAVAMGNAVDAIKSAATLITATNENDGVGRLIAQILAEG